MNVLKALVAVPFVIFGVTLLCGLALWAWIPGTDPADPRNADHPMDYRGD